MTDYKPWIHKNVINLLEKIIKKYTIFLEFGFEKFEYDINIIKNSICNIGFGHGGQFCINICFSNNTIYYCPGRLINFKITKKNFNVFKNLNNFRKKIINELS